MDQWLLSVRVELPTKVGDIAFDDTGVPIEVVLPDVIEDLGLRQHAVGIQHQIAQEFEFGRGEINRDRAQEHFVRVLVHAEVSHTNESVILFVQRATKDGFDAGHDLIQAEGLGDVVIATDGETGDLVLGGVFGGEEEDGTGVAAGAQALGYTETVDVGQHDVQHNEVGLFLEHRGDGLGAGAYRAHHEACEAQAGREQVPNVGFVIDNKNFRSVSHVFIIWETAECCLTESLALSVSPLRRP